ncbi:MAG: M67 family metallopeptidase [Thermoanaerobaculia bacterium]|nr:M67 family metallopeptidase [Thermoanaerobaculia bacterium]
MTDFTQPSSSSILRPDFSAEDSSITTGTGSGTRLVLCPAHRRKLESLAEMSYPFEACGVLAGRLENGEVRVRKVWSARNVGRRVHDRFRLDPEDFLAADRLARERGMEILGIWHSHPNRPAVPSRVDLEEAWDGYSYLILGIDPWGQVDFRSWRRDALRDPSGGAASVMDEEPVVFEDDDPLAAALEKAAPSH